MSKEPNKDEKKLELEEAPPVEAGGMVSEETLIDRIKKVKNSEEKPDISMEKVILFLAENVFAMRKTLEEIHDLFKGAKSTKPVVPTPPVKKEVPPVVKPEIPSVPIEAPSKPSEETVTKPLSPRITEIIEAFKPVEAFVTVDTESSAQFVMIRPRGFLGKGDFAKVGAIAREVGAVYVKQGKESHFKVPKIVGDTPLPKTITEAPKAQPTGTVKDLFPENLAKLLSFTDEGEFTIVRPIKFLGAENFAKVAGIVRNNSGEYISAGKESRFKLPKR